MTRPLVSIVLVTHNEEIFLDRCLAHLEAQDYEPIELVVVDNASSDRSVAKVKGSSLKPTVIENAVGQGWTRATNQGVAAAHGDFLALLNPDAFVPRDFVSAIMAHLREQRDIGVASAAILPPHEPPRPVLMALDDRGGVPMCAALVRRTTFDDLDGFDETFFSYWSETDFCWRSWLLGWRVVEVFGVQAVHVQGAVTRRSHTETDQIVNWSADQIRGGLYAHLKLAPWKRVLTYSLIAAAKTLRNLPRRERGKLLEAWGWNLGHLKQTLQARRAWLGGRAARQKELDRRVGDWRTQQLKGRVRRLASEGLSPKRKLGPQSANGSDTHPRQEPAKLPHGVDNAG